MVSTFGSKSSKHWYEYQAEGADRGRPPTSDKDMLGGGAGAAEDRTRSRTMLALPARQLFTGNQMPLQTCRFRALCGGT